MRQRKAKNMEERLAACSSYMIQLPGKNAGISSEGRASKLHQGEEFHKDYFGNDGELYLEIGCGKGNFIIKKAMENPRQELYSHRGAGDCPAQSVGKGQGAGGQGREARKS